MAKKRPRKRANLERRREDREIYDLLSVLALCLAYGATDISHTMSVNADNRTPASSRRDHPLAREEILGNRERASICEHRGRFFHDHIGRDDSGRLCVP